MTRFVNHLLLALAVTGLSMSCASSGNGPGSGFNLYSPEQDVELGRQSAAQIEQKLPMLNEAASNRLVQRLGARLAAQAPGPDFQYRFRVANLSDLNAFALPGGYIYVHRGLIERVRTEGQLAGVMAHEVAHVALRHHTTQASKATATAAGASLVAGLLGVRANSAAAVVSQLGLDALFLRFSREAEAEADEVGAQMMAQAGYDPRELAQFFAIMRQEAGRDPSRVQIFFSGHPSAADRERDIIAIASTVQVRRVNPVGGLTQAQSALRRLPPAPKLASAL